MFSHKSNLNICFRWLNPFLWKGFNKNLKNEDLYRVLPEDDSKFLGEKLERYINELYIHIMSVLEVEMNGTNFE